MRLLIIDRSTNYDELNEKKPLMTFENHNMGVIDLQFNPQGNSQTFYLSDNSKKINRIGCQLYGLCD